MILVWLIGYLFTLGGMLGSWEDEKEDWTSVAFVILAFLIWPVILGYSVATKEKE